MSVELGRSRDACIPHFARDHHARRKSHRPSPSVIGHRSPQRAVRVRSCSSLAPWCPRRSPCERNLEILDLERNNMMMFSKMLTTVDLLLHVQTVTDRSVRCHCTLRCRHCQIHCAT